MPTHHKLTCASFDFDPEKQLGTDNKCDCEDPIDPSTTLTEALKRMHETLRMAGYPSSRIEVHIPLPDVDAAQREEVIARSIIEETLHPKVTVETIPRRFSRSLGIVNGVFLFTEEQY